MNIFQTIVSSSQKSCAHRFHDFLQFFEFRFEILQEASSSKYPFPKNCIRSSRYAHPDWKWYHFYVKIDVFRTWILGNQRCLVGIRMYNCVDHNQPHTDRNWHFLRHFCIKMEVLCAWTYEIVSIICWHELLSFMVSDSTSTGFPFFLCPFFSHLPLLPRYLSYLPSSIATLLHRMYRPAPLYWPLKLGVPAVYKYACRMF